MASTFLLALNTCFSVDCDPFYSPPQLSDGKYTSVPLPVAAAEMPRPGRTMHPFQGRKTILSTTSLQFLWQVFPIDSSWTLTSTPTCFHSQRAPSPITQVLRQEARAWGLSVRRRVTARTSKIPPSGWLML